MSSNFILGIVFLLLAISGAVLRKTYFEIPTREIKKRKLLGDDSHQDLSKVLNYGTAARGLIWLYLVLTLAISLTLLAISLPVWVSIIISGLIIYFIFSRIPNTKVSSWDRQLVKLMDPSLIWLLKHTNNYINKIYIALAKPYRQHSVQIYDNDDLLKFFKSQSRNPDNRIKSELLLSLERNLAFDSYRVKDVMLPLKRVKTLIESDIVGPIVINELHESGQEYALVKSSSRNQSITGILAFKDLNIKSQGKVGDLMSQTIFYINENNSLNDIFKAFFDTKQTSFIAVNENAKVVGIVGLDSVIKQLLGNLSSIRSGDYNNLEATANLFSIAEEDTQTDE